MLPAPSSAECLELPLQLHLPNGQDAHRVAICRMLTVQLSTELIFFTECPGCSPGLGPPRRHLPNVQDAHHPAICHLPNAHDLQLGVEFTKF